MLHSYQRLSLKAKLVAWVVLAMGAVTAAVITLALWVVNGEMQRSAMDAQAALADSMVQDLDSKITDRRNALQLSAAALGALGLAERAALQAHFNAQPLLPSLFDAVFWVDRAGRIGFDTPEFPGRTGISVADRDYFKQAMAVGTMTVSVPMVSKSTGEPNVVFAAPVRNSAGEVSGVLCGVIYLSRANFVTALSSLHIGKTGYVALISRESPPRVVVHAQRDRVLPPLASPDLNPLWRRALAGGDGTVAERDLRGAESLFTSRHLKSAPWVLLTSYPIESALSAMHQTQRLVMALAAVLLLLAGVGTWWVVARLVSPLVDLRHALDRARAPGPAEGLHVLSQTREVAEVAQACDALVQHHGRVQAELQANELRLRLIVDNMPAQITHIDTTLNYTYANATVARDLGLPLEKIVGRPVRDVRGEAVYELILPHLRTALSGEMQRFEGSHSFMGRWAAFQSYYVPDRDDAGHVRGVYAISFDVTKRMRAEQRSAASEERMRSVLTHAPDAFISIDSAGLITEWNRQAEITFGWQREEVLGRELAQVIVPPELRADHAAGMARFVTGAPSRVVNNRIEVPALKRDGSCIPIELSVAAVREGTQLAAHAFLRDITERRAAQERLASSEKRVRDIADNLPVLIAYVDHEERVQFLNETYRDWLGTDPARVIGKPVAEAMGRRLYALRNAPLRQALAGERVEFEAEMEALGVRRHLHHVYVPDLRPNGEVAGVYALSTDVSVLKQVQHQLAVLARVDPLTDLPNRRAFDERLSDAVARCLRHHRPMALMFLDLDHFKPINDTHGHGVGDGVLREFARRLTPCVRQTDTVARLAGDEFVIVLEDLASAEEALAVARKIGQILEPPFVLDDLALPVTASIGITYLDGAQDITPATALARADAALYDAKRRGRNTFVLFSPESTGLGDLRL